MLLRDAGEREAIEAVWRRLGRESLSDDAHYWRMGDRYALLTTDVIYGRTHIPGGVDYATAGRFFAAINLSDIAAMGGIPRTFLLALSVSPETPVEHVEEFEAGLVEVLDAHGVEFGGGDLKEGCGFTAAGALYGEVEAERIILRRGAEPGDLVYVTGKIGRAAASYHFWKSRGEDPHPMLEVEPRLREGRAASRYVSAGMDLSDGIAEAVACLSQVNRVGIVVDYDSIPLHPLAVEAIEDGADPFFIALTFGGDYELFLTVPPEREEDFLRAMGGTVTRIGEVVKGESAVLKGGERFAFPERGYQHFS